MILFGCRNFVSLWMLFALFLLESLYESSVADELLLEEARIIHKFQTFPQERYSTTPMEWMGEGVQCEVENGHCVGIFFLNWYVEQELLEELDGLPQLEHVTFAGCDFNRRVPFSPLNLMSLKWFSVSCERKEDFPHGIFEIAANSPDISSILFRCSDGMPLNSEDISTLKQFHTLEMVTPADTPMSLPEISQLLTIECVRKSITELRIIQTEMNEQTAELLYTLPSLEKLTLNSENSFVSPKEMITDDFLLKIKDVNLSELDINGRSQLTDQSVPILLTWNTLKKLAIEFPCFSESGKKELEKKYPAFLLNPE